MPPIPHSGIQSDRDTVYKEKDRFEEGQAQVDPFGYLWKSSFILKKDTTHLYHNDMYLFLSEYLVDIIVQLVHIQHILKGGTKHVHDVKPFVEWYNPSANVVHLVMGRRAVLGKGDKLVFAALMHVMVCHLVLAEIQANHEKRAFFVGVRLIDEHW